MRRPQSVVIFLSVVHIPFCALLLQEVACREMRRTVRTASPISDDSACDVSHLVNWLFPFDACYLAGDGHSQVMVTVMSLDFAVTPPDCDSGPNFTQATPLRSLPVSDRFVFKQVFLSTPDFFLSHGALCAAFPGCFAPSATLLWW